MDNIIGPPVTGKNFKFREKEVKDILDLLSAGNSVLMIGIRRLGKSSVMKEVCNQASPKWVTAYHDLQAMKEPSDLFSVLLKSLPKDDLSQVVAFWSQAKSIPPKIIDFVISHFTKLGGAGVSVELQKSIVDFWTPLTEGIEFVLKKESEHPIVFALDEFPVFVENMLNSGRPPAMVEQILRQLKDWRNNISHFRLLIGGSISLDRILSKHKISGSVIGDLTRYSLSPFTREQAKSFLSLLAESHDTPWYGDKLIEETLDILDDYYPFFLQAFFFQLRTQSEPQDKSLLTIYENHFIPFIVKGFFDQFDDRLKKNYSDRDRKIASDILDFISLQENYKTSYSQVRAVVSSFDIEDLELNDLLSELISDEIFTFDSRTFEYSFTINLVARWWSLRRRIK